MSGWSVRRLASFDDVVRDGLDWDGIQRSGTTDEVFSTLGYQTAWWRSHGRGELLLLVAEHDRRPVALAPLFADQGMVFLVGSGGSDYLDLLGQFDEEGLTAVLDAARSLCPDFVGFLFYHVLADSPTARLLASVAPTLELDLVDQGEHPAPYLDATVEPGAYLAAAARTSLVRHTRWFERQAPLTIQHLTDPGTIAPLLDGLFAQHVARWRATTSPSLFEAAAEREFYRALTDAGATGGWLRFTRILWRGEVIAQHFGFCHRQRFLWYKPSFAIEHARRSPGEVLLRALLLASDDQRHLRFDFGLGDEQFKKRFQNGEQWVRNWGLYPRPGRPTVGS